MVRDPPICPICGRPFMMGCDWYGPAPDHYIYTICTRCDVKASYDMDYRSMVIEKLNALGEKRKASKGNFNHA